MTTNYHGFYLPLQLAHAFSGTMPPEVMDQRFSALLRPDRPRGEEPRPGRLAGGRHYLSVHPCRASRTGLPSDPSPPDPGGQDSKDHPRGHPPLLEAADGHDGQRRGIGRRRAAVLQPDVHLSLALARRSDLRPHPGGRGPGRLPAAGNGRIAVDAIARATPSKPTSASRATSR